MADCNPRRRKIDRVSVQEVSSIRKRDCKPETRRETAVVTSQFISFGWGRGGCPTAEIAKGAPFAVVHPSEHSYPKEFTMQLINFDFKPPHPDPFPLPPGSDPFSNPPAPEPPLPFPSPHPPLPQIPRPKPMALLTWRHRPPSRFRSNQIKVFRSRWHALRHEGRVSRQFHCRY